MSDTSVSPEVRVSWGVSDVMRAFPDLTWAEARDVLKATSKYWKGREIGLLRRLAVEAGAHDGEPHNTEMGPPGRPPLP